MTEIIRVLIADDHPIVRQGMELVIGTAADLELVGQASNGEEAVQLARQTGPDVLVIDLQMPVKSGLAAIEEINREDTSVQILVVTSFPDDDKVFSAIKAGASGYMLKDSTPDQLLEAIRTVHRGESAMTPSIARKLMTEVRRTSNLPLSADPLTPREIEVLQYLAQGATNREIAQSLSVSIRTVTTHVRNILDKLHLANRTQAALYAVSHGYTPDSDT